MDAYAWRILIDHILHAYQHIIADEHHILPQNLYTHYIESEELYKNSVDYGAHRSFWMNKYQQIADIPFTLSKNTSETPAHSSRMRMLFSKEESEQIFELIQKTKSSVFRLFTAMTYLIFHKSSGQDQLLFGAPVHNRFSKSYKDTVGMFVNMLPFHLVANEDTSFTELLDSIRGELKANLQHQDYPYDLLIKDIRERYPQRPQPELFDIIINYQNASYPSEVSHVQWHHSGYDNYPLSIHISKRGKDQSLILEIDYRSALFQEIEIELLFSFYKQLLQQIIEDPKQKLASFNLISDATHQILEGANALIPYPSAANNPILAYCASQFWSNYKQKQQDMGLILQQKNKEKTFWSELLKEHTFSFFRDSTSPASYDVYTFSIPDEISQKLISISNESDQRLFIILSGSILLLFHRFSGASKTAIASSLLSQESYQDLINTCLPIYADFDPSDTYKDLLLKLIQHVNQAISHQDYPIKSLLQQNYDPGLNTFDVKVFLENIQRKEFALYSDAALIFNFRRAGKKIVAELCFDQQLISTSVVEKLSANLGLIFKDLSEDVNKKVGDLTLPHFNRFSYCLAGENAIVLSCAQMLLDRHHNISAIISNNKSLEDFARQKNIPCFSFDDPRISHISRDHSYDYFLRLEDQGNPLPVKLPGKIFKYHDSLLPKYPGYYATSRAILNQDNKHGVSWYLTDENEEYREICAQLSFDITPQETSHSLNLKCIGHVLHAFESLLKDLEDNQLKSEFLFISEDQAKDKNCIPFAAGLISFKATAEEIDAKIRALNFENYDNPICLAKVFIEGHLFVPTAVEILPENAQEKAGTLVSIEHDHLVVATNNKNLRINDYKPLTGARIEELKLYEGLNIQ